MLVAVVKQVLMDSALVEKNHVFQFVSTIQIRIGTIGLHQPHINKVYLFRILGLFSSGLAIDGQGEKVKELSHLPSNAEIEFEISKIVDTLKTKGIEPKVVTICRSCNSGFCPQDSYQYIETKFREALTAYLSETQYEVV